MHKLGELAEFLQAELKGDPEYIISGIAPLATANKNEISFLGKAQGFVKSSKQYLDTTKAGAVILNAEDAKNYSGNILLVRDPYVSYAKLTALFNNASKPKVNIHKDAVVAETAKLGNNVIIEAGCVISENVRIGDDCHLYPNVTIYHDVHIGNRVIIHSGAVIGSDGFGYANDQGIWRKIYQLGGLQIGDDVEIGANTCIDRGALENTIIENGVKLDNQIQIGHNVKIGAHTIIAGCTGIAGSTVIGKYCMIGGACNINGHINITDQVIIAGASSVERPILKPGVYSSSLEVQPHQKWLRTKILLSQLSNIVKRLRKLEGKQNAEIKY